MRQFEAGEIVAGKYRLQHPLAKGGMGSVWTALNEQLGVPVAIKFMATDALGSAELVARFEREARAAAQMRIPQVVQIFEHGVFLGVPFMAMELLEGEDLSKRLRNRGRLSLAETAGIVSEVCKALRRANDLGIVHRDLKPANIFIARSGDEEIIKVLDFGIAKLLGGVPGIEATKTGALIGTPNYMSPEQAHRKNRQVDHRSDLWSLGVIAFRAVTGKLPFAGGDPVDVLMRVITTTAPAASEMAPDLGPEVDRFFARALAPDPDKRFQNARDFAEAMNALVIAPKPQPLGQSWSSGAPPPVTAPAQPLGQSWGGEAPPPRASSPGEVGPPRAMRGTLPMNTPSMPRGAPAGRSPDGAPGIWGSGGPDSADGVATLPIQRSPVAQAYLAAASPQPSAAKAGPGVAQAGSTAPLPGRQLGSAPSLAPPETGAPQRSPTVSSPAAALSPQGPVEAWNGSSPDGKFRRTLPLDIRASDVLHQARLSAGSNPAISGGTATTRTTDAAAAATSAGDTAGTITSATGEMPIPRPRRTSYVVWGALAAAVLVILVVGSVVVTAVTAPPEPEPIPLPPTAAPTLPADPPGSTLAPLPTATAAPRPTATASASAPATASGAGSAVPTTKPSATAAAGAKPITTGGAKAQPTATSAIFGKPTFAP